MITDWAFNLFCIHAGTTDYLAGSFSFATSAQILKDCFLTLQASLSIRAMMEFLKSVAAVRGRLVTSVMLSFPSGHMSFSTGSELKKRDRKIQSGHSVCHKVAVWNLFKNSIAIMSLYHNRFHSKSYYCSHC